VIEKLGFSQAQSVLAQRDRASFRNLADVQNIVGTTVPVNNNLITISSRFFLVEGTSQVDAALIRTRALLERRDQHVYVIWRQ
jgi:general secretion pathway protein K